MYIRIILTVFICLSAMAQKPNVVLLSSLATPKIWYHSSKWEIERTLNKIFKNRFKESGYNIVIKEKVDQIQLRDELSNPNNIAVYWVSHSASYTNNGGGLGSSGAVVDYYGKDVKNLFKSVHPNIKHLALVGCNANALINKYKEDGHYSNNKNLLITSFDKKIDARIGLRKAIKKSNGTIGKVKKRLLSYPLIIETEEIISDFYQNKSCLKENQVYPVILTRTANKDASIVTIKNNYKTLAIFPSIKEGETQVKTIYIASKNIGRRSLKLTIDTNIFSTNQRQYVGDFDFSTSWDSSWKLFAKRDGTPLGITKNLFIYKGETPSIEDQISHQPYSCLE